MEIWRDGLIEKGGENLHINIQLNDIKWLIRSGFSVIRFAENTRPQRHVAGWDMMDKVWVSLKDLGQTPEPEIRTDPGGDIYVDLPNSEKLKQYPDVMSFDIDDENLPQLALRSIEKVYVHNIPQVGHERFTMFTLPEHLRRYS